MSLLQKQQVEQYFDVVGYNSSTGEVTFICPECGDKKGHRSVNLKTGVTFCFRCGKGESGFGQFTRWAKSHGFIVESDGSYRMPVSEIFAVTGEKDIYIPTAIKTPLPKGFTRLTEDPDSVRARWIDKMARRKNLTWEDMVEADVGFTRVDPRWEAYAIFPVTEWNVNVYYQGRTYYDRPGEPTKLFPTRTEVLNGAGSWVYNIDEIRERRPHTVIVVESILNVLSLRKALRKRNMLDSVVPACVFKHNISRVQFLKLVREPSVKELCFMFDHDAVEKVWATIGNLGNRAKLTVAEMPATAENKKLDPNDDVEAAMHAYLTRKDAGPSNIVGRLLHRRWASTSGREVDMRSMRFD